MLCSIPNLFKMVYFHSRISKFELFLLRYSIHGNQRTNETLL